MAVVLLAAILSWLFLLTSRWAFFEHKADFYARRERIFVETFARLQRVPEYRSLGGDETEIGKVMLVLEGGTVCVDRPGYYLREIARLRRLKEVFEHAARHPVRPVGPISEDDELGERWSWNWFAR